MPVDIRTTDKKGRLCLPRSFANATVIVEQISDTEVRIRRRRSFRKMKCASMRSCRVLHSRIGTATIFLALLDNPPPPNEAFRRAAAKYMKRYG